MVSDDVGSPRPVTVSEGSVQVGVFRSAWQRYWPKGFWVSGVNGFCLLLLSLGSADQLHRSVNALQPFVSVLVALGFAGLASLFIAVVSLPGMRPRWWKISVVLIVLVVCGYPYFNFVQNSYNRRIADRTERAEASSKIASDVSSVYEVEGDNLDVAEYREVVKSTSFPDVPDSAENISFSSVQDEPFWGGHTFDLSYEVPLDRSDDASPSFQEEGYRGEVLTEPDGGKLKVWFRGFVP